MKLILNSILITALFIGSNLEASEQYQNNLKTSAEIINNFKSSSLEIINYVNKNTPQYTTELEAKIQNKKIEIPKVEILKKGLRVKLLNDYAYIDQNNENEFILKYKNKSSVINNKMSYNEIYQTSYDLLNQKNLPLTSSIFTFFISNSYAVLLIDDLIASAIVLSILSVVAIGGSAYLDSKNFKNETKHLADAQKASENLCAGLNYSQLEYSINSDVIDQYNLISKELSDLCTLQMAKENKDRVKICEKAKISKNCLKRAIDYLNSSNSSRGNSKKIFFNEEKDQFEINSSKSK